MSINEVTDVESVNEVLDSESMKKQLDDWVNGISTHNHEHDMCCPDFSCCVPDCLASKEERIAFANGDNQTRLNMCMNFLRIVMEKTKVTDTNQVYISGELEGPESNNNINNQ